jgi:hypothetical protein
MTPMLDSRVLRLRSLAAQLAASRIERAALLELAAAEERGVVDATIRTEAERLAAELEAAGHVVAAGGWIRPTVAAAALGVTEQALRARRHRGTGPRFVRNGGSIWYRLRDLAAWRNVPNCYAAGERDVR